jgi:hypothetical protein
VFTDHQVGGVAGLPRGQQPAAPIGDARPTAADPALRAQDVDSEGIARAVLSERYRFVDNLDVLLAVLDSIRKAGADVQVGRCDLTERRMYVQIASNSVAARAQALLRDYVSPFTGALGADNPLVFVLSNSETGHGSFSITPRLIAQVCSNGYTITRDAMREVHLGGGSAKASCSGRRAPSRPRSS